MQMTMQTSSQSMKTTESRVQPGNRGSRQCWCQGQLLVMLGHYGWILPLDDIDHPALDKTEGRIYLHKRDIAGGKQLFEGDMLGFYLYIDEQGLGAEGACLLNVDDTTTKTLSAEAAEFVPPPPGFSTLSDESPGMSGKAKEFVPAQAVRDASAAQTVDDKANVSPWYKKESSSHKGKFYYVNSKTGKTSWTCPDDYFEPVVQSVPVAPQSNHVYMHSVAAINLAYLSDDSSDDDSSDNDDYFAPCLPASKQARHRSVSPAASTSAGLSSDDDSEGSDTPGAEELPEACLRGKKFHPPPGLSLPPLPSQMALGVLARAGLLVEPEKPRQKSAPWKSIRTSEFSSITSESTAWERESFPPLSATV